MSPLDIPHSTSTVSVSVIDSTRMTGLPWNLFLGPPLEGLKSWDCSDYSFLITHTDSHGKSRRLLFDMSPAADYRRNLPPPQLALLDGWEANGAHISVKEQIYDTLAQQDIHFTSSDALLWSHPHWDHMGKIQMFPKDVPLLVGDGVQATFGPGWPEKEDAPWRTEDLEGRTVKDISFDRSHLDIGGLRALDYFGDGSFYLLDAPGHCVGHLNALARVKTDSFVYLGADAYHHGSQIRPNSGAALPNQVSFTALSCPGDMLLSLYPNIKDHQHDRYANFCQETDPGRTPFLTIGWGENDFTVATNASAAVDTISKIQAFDADDRVFCISSHDLSLADVVDFFPQHINNWKSLGWKEASKWQFLKDFEPVFKGRIV